MKKIISIMAAGALLLSSTSVFAAWDYKEKHSSTFGWASGYTTPAATIPAQLDGIFSFENNGNSSMTIEGAVRADGDNCLKVVSTESNDYLKYSRDSNQHTKMSMDIMISGENGLRLKWREFSGSYKNEKDVMEFSNDGTIHVWENSGYSSKVQVKWEKNKWYNISLIFDMSKDVNAAPFILELRENNASGNLINSWVGMSGTANQTSTGFSQACFVTQGATTFYVDNPSFGFMSDEGVSPINYDNPNPYMTTKFVADGKIVNDIASMKGKTVYAEFSVKDTDLTATSSKLVIASYDANKKLQTLDMAEAFLEDAKLSSANIAVPADAAEVKMFIWDLGAGFKPLVDAIVVNK